jgi:hypothetical protein
MILLGAAAPTVLIAAAAIPAGASISLASVLWETTLQQHSRRITFACCCLRLAAQRRAPRG